MRRMIHGDLRRIFRKPGYHIFAAILYVWFLFWTIDAEPSENIKNIHDFVNYIGILLISLPVLLSVYGDELHSGTMQGVIGRGLSRGRLTLGKFIDCACLSTPMFFGLYLMIYFKNLLMDITLTPRQYEMLAVYLALRWTKLLIILAITAFFILMGWNMVVGILADFLLIYIMEPVLLAVQEETHIAVLDVSFYGLLDRGYAAIEAGNTAWQLPAAIILYICPVLLLTAVCFRRKELSL